MPSSKSPQSASPKYRQNDRQLAALKPDTWLLAGSLITLSNLFRRESALTLQRLFDLTLVEGHILAHLGFDSPLSLDTLSDRIGLAKSQISRIVATLVRRRLVKREGSNADGREVKLSLTSRGFELHAAFVQNALIKNKSFTKGLALKDLEYLKELMDRLTVNIREMLSREQELAANKSRSESFAPD
jgi:DNA-binding MarR family transcriptional regulator